MQIVKNTENRESIYELNYDEQLIKELIADIIKNCSYRKRTRCAIEAHSQKEAIKIISSKTNYVGDKLYENVTDIRAEEVHDPFDYWRHGDPAPYSFDADLLVSPRLVSFLINLINDKPIDYDWFTSRKELSEKENAELKIKELDAEINQISNFDTQRKISMLEYLQKCVKDLNSIPSFDYEILSKYYDLAEKHISLELVQETFVYKKVR